MLKKWLECWRFYDAQHKNEQIAVCAHPKKIARKNPQIRKNEMQLREPNGKIQNRAAFMCDEKKKKMLEKFMRSVFL